MNITTGRSSPPACLGWVRSEEGSLLIVTDIIPKRTPFRGPAAAHSVRVPRAPRATRPARVPHAPRTARPAHAHDLLRTPVAVPAAFCPPRPPPTAQPARRAGAHAACPLSCASLAACRARRFRASCQNRCCRAPSPPPRRRLPRRRAVVGGRQPVQHSAVGVGTVDAKDGGCKGRRSAGAAAGGYGGRRVRWVAARQAEICQSNEESIAWVARQPRPSHGGMGLGRR